MDEMAGSRPHEVHDPHDVTQRRLHDAEVQLQRMKRVEAVRKRQRERLLQLLAESMAELGISGAELRAACRDYQNAEKAARR